MSAKKGSIRTPQESAYLLLGRQTAGLLVLLQNAEMGLILSVKADGGLAPVMEAFGYGVKNDV